MVEGEYWHWCERVCARACRMHWAGAPPGWVSWEAFLWWPVPGGCPPDLGWLAWEIWAQVEREFRAEWGLP